MSRLTAVSATETRGWLYLHSVPLALRPHVDWAVAAVLDRPPAIKWSSQPVAPGNQRAELPWQAQTGTAARLASRLASFGKLRFEITEEPAPGCDGQRYCYTPSLGSFTSVVGANGDLQLSEDRLRAALAAEARGERSLAQALPELLGQAWDDELEAFRVCTEEDSVRWLHQVV